MGTYVSAVRPETYYTPPPLFSLSLLFGPEVGEGSSCET